MDGTVELPIRGEAGLAWLDRQGQAGTVIPPWPRSRRMVVVAVVRTAPGAPLEFHAVTSRGGLEAIARRALTAAVLYYAVPRSAVAGLSGDLPAALACEDPPAEGP